MTFKVEQQPPRLGKQLDTPDLATGQGVLLYLRGHHGGSGMYVPGEVVRVTSVSATVKYESYKPQTAVVRHRMGRIRDIYELNEDWRSYFAACERHKQAELVYYRLGSLSRDGKPLPQAVVELLLAIEAHL